MGSTVARPAPFWLASLEVLTLKILFAMAVVPDTWKITYVLSVMPNLVYLASAWVQWAAHTVDSPAPQCPAKNQQNLAPSMKYGGVIRKSNGYRYPKRSLIPQETTKSLIKGLPAGELRPRSGK